MLPFQLKEELGRRPKDESFWTYFYAEVGGQIDRITSMLSSLSEGSDLAFIPDSEEFCLQTVIDSAVEMVFAEPRHQMVSLTIKSDLPLMKGDPKRSGQMVRSLLQEAKTAIAESAEIEIDLVCREDSAGTQMTILDNEELIPEEDPRHFFEPFYVRTQRREDIGSNLLACYLTAFSHGATIRAYRSEHGRHAMEVCILLVPPGRERIEMIRQIRDFSCRHVNKTAFLTR